jgi:hypothetical protein
MFTISIELHRDGFNQGILDSRISRMPSLNNQNSKTTEFILRVQISLPIMSLDLRLNTPILDKNKKEQF